MVSLGRDYFGGDYFFRPSFLIFRVLKCIIINTTAIFFLVVVNLKKMEKKPLRLEPTGIYRSDGKHLEPSQWFLEI